jgi:hypothetical protein
MAAFGDPGQKLSLAAVRKAELSRRVGSASTLAIDLGPKDMVMPSRVALAQLSDRASTFSCRISTTRQKDQVGRFLSVL